MMGYPGYALVRQQQAREAQQRCRLLTHQWLPHEIFSVVKEPLHALPKHAAERKEYDQLFSRMVGTMFRKGVALLVMMLGCFIRSGAAEESKWQDGAWDIRLVVKPANKSVYVTTASGPEACAAVLKFEVIKNISAADGYVWTDEDVTLFSHEKSEFADSRQEVVGMNCSLVPK